MKKKEIVKRRTSYLWGSIIGFLNGFFASGGGIVAVLVLEKVFLLKKKQSHATSIAIILPLTIASAFVYSHRGYADMNFIIKTALGTSLGAVLGALVLSRLPSRFIRMGFGIVMVIASLKMFFG